MDTFSLEGQVAVVTGGLGLLGRHHCQALAEAGANVVVCDLDDDECWAFADELPTHSTAKGSAAPHSIGAGVDVTDAQAIKVMLDIVLLEFDRVDVLVNNAAVNDMFETPALAAEQSKFENYPLAMWRKLLEVNVTGMFLCSQIIGAHMARQGSGSIINIASTYGIVAPD